MSFLHILEGGIVPAAVLFSGGFFLIKTRAFFITKPRRFFSLVRVSDKSERKALMLALAGTLGVGNIFGVGTALSLGGPGALFWMIFSSFFAMMLKYAETLLALKKRKRLGGEFHGGAMYYLAGRAFPVIFATLVILTSFTLGSALQSSAAGDCISDVFGVPSYLTTLSLSIVTFVIILSGKNKLFDFVSALIPLLTVLYAFFCIAVIFSGRDRIPAVFVSIIKNAFDFRAFASGGGFTALRYGVIRGLISNEAGCGTSPIAHSSGDSDDLHRAASMGIVEVFVDTVILCTLTGLSILICGGDGGSASGILSVFSSFFGSFSSYALCLSVYLFALASIVCWSFYGTEAMKYLTFGVLKKETVIPEKVYSFVFCAAIVLPSFISPDFFWSASDLFVALMCVINISGLLINRNIID